MLCSGDDVKQIMAGAGERVSSGLRAEPRLTPAADALLHTDVPVIAAVNALLVGHGARAHGRHPSRVRARFGELFVKRGSNCDVAGLGRLAQVVGRMLPNCCSRAGSSMARPGHRPRVASVV